MRGVCRDCYRLGLEELTYRQAVRDMGRALRWGSVIPWKHRKMIEGFLGHQNARIRVFAAELIASDARERREWAELRLEEELLEERALEALEAAELEAARAADAAEAQNAPDAAELEAARAPDANPYAAPGDDWFDDIDIHF